MNTPRKRSSALPTDLFHNQQRAVFRSSYSRKRVVVLKQYGKLFFYFITSVFLLSLAGSNEDYQELTNTRIAWNQSDLQSMRNFSFSLGVFRKGISLVSACQNKHESLRATIPSWVDVEAVDEIVLIDWSSNPSLSFVVEEVDGLSKKHPPIYVVQVQNQSKWEPSRAFNIGFRAARFSQVLKVDCDHKVRQDFVANHALPKDAFFAGSQHLERASFDENLRGTLFIEKTNFFRSGGYDERIQEYAGEHENLLQRLQKLKLKRIDIDYNTLLQTLHQDEFGLSRYQFSNVSAEVEAKVNLKLLDNVPQWTSYTGWKSFSLNVKRNSIIVPVGSHSHPNVQYVILQTKVGLSSIRETSSPDAIVQTRETVVSSMLSSEFEIPEGLSKALPMSSKMRLMAEVRGKANVRHASHAPKIVFLHCQGGIFQRLQCLTSGLSYAQQIGQVPVVIWVKEKDVMITPLEKLFHNTTSFVAVGSLQEGWDPLTFFRSMNFEGITFEDVTTNSSGKNSIEDNALELKHMYLKMNGTLTTHSARYTSEHAMQEQLIKLGIDESIRLHLQGLEDRGLSSSVGIFVPGGFEDSDKIAQESFLEEVKEEYHKVAKSQTVAPVIYLDAGVKMQSLMRAEYEKVIFAPMIGCEKGAAECDRNKLLKMYAMSKTLSFCFAKLDDEESKDFVSMVRITRGDSFSW